VDDDNHPDKKGNDSHDAQGGNTQFVYFPEYLPEINAVFFGFRKNPPDKNNISSEAVEDPHGCLILNQDSNKLRNIATAISTNFVVIISISK
jgi:hypothetical protein